MTVEDIARLSEGESLRWTSHILQRLFQRNIRIDDVKAVLAKGEIIEQYPNDYPFPSCLVLGYTAAGQPLHVVCGSNGVEMWLITAYFPNPVKWTEDFRQRRSK
jgi:hypothetical protein